MWIDELPAAPDAWAAAFLDAGAKEVLDALGGFVLTFRAGGAPPAAQLRAVRAVIDKQMRGWDGVCVAVAMPAVDAAVPAPAADPAAAIAVAAAAAQAGRDAAEDACLMHGFEYIEYMDGKRGVRDEYGERVGVDRVIEALEANDWAGDGELGLSDEEEDGEDVDALKPIGDEMEREMFGLRSAIYGNDDDDDEDPADQEKEVEKLEAAMAKMMMLKGAPSDRALCRA